MANNKDVAHAWAHQTQPRLSGSHFYFEGPVLYSYGPHYVAGRIVPVSHGDPGGATPAVVLNRTRHSATTDRHVALAHRAAPVASRTFLFADADPDAELRSIQKDHEDLPSAMTPYKRWPALIDLAHRAESLARFGMLTENPALQTAAGELADRLRQEAHAIEQEYDRRAEEIRNRQQTRRRQENDRARKIRATAADRFRQGLPLASAFTDAEGYTLLRLRNRQVETSLGITLSEGEARRVWRWLQSARNTGDTDRLRVETLRAGSFTLSAMTTEDFTFGCHKIRFTDAEAIINQLSKPLRDYRES